MSDLPDFNHDDYRDDLAMSLGHLCLSYAALELVLVRLMADMAGDGDLSAADRALGRRGFSERVALVLQHAGRAQLAPDQLDTLDLMLGDAVALAGTRHEYVHFRYRACFAQAELPVQESAVTEQGTGAVWDLVIRIDSLISDLVAWSDGLKSEA